MYFISNWLGISLPEGHIRLFAYYNYYHHYNDLCEENNYDKYMLSSVCLRPCQNSQSSNRQCMRLYDFSLIIHWHLWGYVYFIIEWWIISHFRVRYSEILNSGKRHQLNAFQLIAIHCKVYVKYYSWNTYHDTDFGINMRTYIHYPNTTIVAPKNTTGAINIYGASAKEKIGTIVIANNVEKFC